MNILINIFLQRGTVICPTHDMVTLETASNTLGGCLQLDLTSYYYPAAAGPAAQSGCCVDEHRPNRVASWTVLVSTQ